MQAHAFLFHRIRALSLAGLFILNQLFQVIEGNIFSPVKFHELWKAGVPAFSMTNNLQLHHLTKSCSSADTHFIHLQLRDAIQLLLKQSQFCNSSAKTLELEAQTSSCPWQVPAETRLPHQTQLSSSYSLPWLSSFAQKNFRTVAWQISIWMGLAAGEAWANS